MIAIIIRYVLCVQSLGNHHQVRIQTSALVVCLKIDIEYSRYHKQN